MKRRALGIAVALAALAVLVNVFALRSATVPGTMSIGIVNSSAALLAVAGGSDEDLTTSDTPTGLSISVEKGVQQGATYVFHPAFTVTNNSDDTDGKVVTVALAQGTGAVVSLVDATGAPVANSATLQEGDSLTFGIKVTSITGATSTTVSPTITVSAADVP